MIERKSNEQLGQILFTAAFVIFIIKQIFDISDLFSVPDLVDDCLIIVFFSIIFLKLLIQRYTVRSFLLLLAASAFISFSCIMSGSYTFLLGYFCVIAIQDVDLDRLLRVGIGTKLFFILVHVGSYAFVSIFFGSIMAITRNGILRHGFFLGHPNTFTFVLTWVLIEYIFINYRKIKLPHLAVLWAIELVSYMFTNSNSGLIVFTLITVMILFEKSTLNFSKVLSFIVRYGHAFLSLFFLVFISIYPVLTGALKDFWRALDIFFNGRTLFGAYACEIYGITSIGHKVSFPDKVFWRDNWLDIGNMVYFDNYYVGQYILFGFVYLIIISAAFFLLSKKLENREKIIIIALTFYGIMEAYITTVVYCFALLIIGKYLYVRRPPSLSAHDPPPQDTRQTG